MNRGPPLDGLSREQKLDYAAYHLGQHEQNIKLGICNTIGMKALLIMSCQRQDTRDGAVCA